VGRTLIRAASGLTVDSRALSPRSVFTALSRFRSALLGLAPPPAARSPAPVSPKSKSASGAGEFDGPSGRDCCRSPQDPPAAAGTVARWAEAHPHVPRPPPPPRSPLRSALTNANRRALGRRCLRFGGGTFHPPPGAGRPVLSVAQPPCTRRRAKVRGTSTVPRFTRQPACWLAAEDPPAAGRMVWLGGQEPPLTKPAFRNDSGAMPADSKLCGRAAR
jgi:hypothetical protein